MDFSPNTILKVSVLQSGKLLADGSETSLADLDARMTQIQSRNGVVYYYREGGLGEPPPIWKDVMDVVAKHRLPISMSSKPDFSDFVDEKGVSHPRSGENPKPKSSDVVARLCQHIVQKRQKMIVDTNQTEVVWSDGAILEVGTNFPGALQELISRPTHHHDIRSFVKQLEAGSTSQWRDASVARSARGDSYATIRSSDGKISASVESLYVEYLAHRYPTAIIRVRRESEPVIFVVDGKIRASVMPVRF